MRINSLSEPVLFADDTSVIIWSRNFENFSSVYLLININQLDALNFIISLFQASTYFEHMCLSSGRQNCIIQSGIITLKQVSGLKLVK